MGTPERIGVLDACGYWIEGRESPIPSTGVSRAVHMAATARHLGLTELWVHPSAMRAVRLADTWARVAESDTGWNVQPDAPSHWHSAVQRGTLGVLNLAIVANMPRQTPWHRAENGRALLAALLAFRGALGEPWRRSAGATGTRLIRAVHAGHTALSLDLPGDPPPPALDSTEVALVWRRELTPAERGRKYMHSYDRNGMYLGVCSSLALGFGQAEHVTDARGVAAVYAEHRNERGRVHLPPGYWRVDAPSWEIAGTDGMQPPLVGTARQARKRTRTGVQAAWVTSPTLDLLNELERTDGFSFTVAEAYIWREHHRPLEPWYKRIRDARSALMESADAGAPLALDAVKQLYSYTQGWFGSTRWDRTGDPLYRPDWRHAIVGQARANMFRTWAEMHRAGVHPFEGDTDCWYIVSDEPDPLAACPAALRLGDGLAHWKVKDAAIPLAEVLPVLDGHHDLQEWVHERERAAVVR